MKHFFLCLLFLCSYFGPLFSQQSAATYTNPLLPKGPDPWALWHNGNYFYMHTMGDKLVLWKTNDITDLKNAEQKMIWTPKDPSNSKDLWAPEIHYINGKWYVYYAADDGNTDNHQLYVLENSNKDPFKGEFVMKGRISTDKNNNWAIDGSVFAHNNELYMVWSGWQTRRVDTETQCIYIAKMKNPWTLGSERVLISKPELEWEKHWINEKGWTPSYTIYVNEGPQPLKSPKGKYIHIVYSASGCWTPYYALGMLTAEISTNLLDPKSWIKSPQPVFRQSPENGVYGTGHNSFFKSPDGKEDYILYHARDTETDPPGAGDVRSPRAQKITWDANDYPVMGVPLPNSTKLPKPSPLSNKIEIVDRPDMNQSNVNYNSNKSPLLPSAFIKLPVGSIQPGGWVKKYLELQRDGLTGKLGEISAWLEKKDNAWLSKDGKGSHGWEEVPYWLKGYGDMAYILGDQKMIDETKIWIEATLSSQRKDGYFGPWIEKKGTPDLWGNMIMLWCLQSYYEYSNDNRIISFMTDYFKWQNAQPDSILLKDYWENSRGGDNLYSVYWLYNITGDNYLLELGNKLHRNTANWMQADKLPNWHNVNIAQCFREPATYYLQSHDSTHLMASYNNHLLIRKLYGQVPGGMFGGDENCREGYHDPRQGVETCGMVEQMNSDEMMFRITGDPLWADHCEDVAFNTYPAAVMPDFKALRYITSPNMVLSDGKNHHPGIDNGGPFLMMNPFSSRCCQHNHAQGWPYYAENLWMATPDNGLVAALYAESTVNAKVGDNKNITLEQKTKYPFDEKILISIKSSDDVNFPLYLRIPEWCNNASISLNGEKLEVQTLPSKYVKINRTWKTGDYIELTLNMHLKMRTWEQNGNSVSINHGPITYSLLIDENYIQKDTEKTAIWDSKWQKNADPSQWPSFEIHPNSAWNYALVIDKNNLEKSFDVIKKNWPTDNFPFTTKSAPIEIKTKGVKIPGWIIDENGLCSFVPKSPVTMTESPEEITLIPMGAARLRIAAFPINNKTTNGNMTNSKTPNSKK